MARTPSSVIVIAPEGAGKTTNAFALMRMFGCTSIVDDWDGRKPLPHGALALTTLSSAELADATSNGSRRRSRT